MAAIALFGAVAYRSLPVADLPTVDFPTVQVQAALPGADPATMASTLLPAFANSSDSAACVQNILVSGFVGLRPSSDFASRMELEMELLRSRLPRRSASGSTRASGTKPGRIRRVERGPAQCPDP